MAAIFNDWSDAVNSNRNELVFADKNKTYGAYQLRTKYGRTLLISGLIGTGMLVLAIVIPMLMTAITREKKEKVLSNEQIMIDQNLEDMKKELPPPPPPPPPPTEPPKIETAKFVETEIVDEEVKEEIKTQEELTDTKVGQTDQKGDDEGEIVIPEDKGSGSGPVEEVKQEPFTIVEEMPSFQGGEVAMMKWIQSHVQYPQYEKEADISGKVFVRFVVQPDGTVANVQVVRGVSKGLDKEAIRVVSAMPKWNAGKQGGRSVPVYFSLPINFVLN